MRVLIVDDEKNIRAVLSMCLEAMGAEVLGVATGVAALAAIGASHYDLAFVDLKLDRESGLDLIPELLAVRNDVAIVLITAYGDSDTAAEAARRGAWNYLAKPFTPAQIRELLARFKGCRSLNATPESQQRDCDGYRLTYPP